MRATLKTLHSMPGASLRNALLSVAQQAERDIQSIAAGDAERHVHNLRVRMKKLRALLKLIKPCVTEAAMERIKDDMRTLKKAFATSRDQHVLNTLLEELNDGGTAFPAFWIVAGDKGEPSGLPSPGQLRHLLATARKLTRELRALKPGQLTEHDVARRYARSYAKGRRQYHQCERRAAADKMHHWRVPVKDHYYQTLILTGDRHRCERARKLGSMLGRLHDFALLRDHLRRNASTAFADSIKRQMRNLRARIFRKAGRLFAPARRKLKGKATTGK